MEHLKICRQICNRDKCAENIASCTGIIRDKCVVKGKSCIESLNEKQVKYILSNKDTDIYLKACPGSGKTEVLGIKSAYEINKWNDKNSGIAILTFTNSAEDEIRERVEGYLNKKIGYPHFIGTFTSWIHGYIGHPFLAEIMNYDGNKEGDKSIKVIESESNSGFLKAFSTKYSYGELGNVRANEYYYDLKNNRYKYVGSVVRNGDNILSGLLEQDEWRSKELSRVKEIFWKNGYSNYEDIEHNIYKVLKSNNDITNIIAHRFPNIFVDECQDLSYIELQILNLLKDKGVHLHFIGDIDQSIYAFRNIDPKDIIDFINDNNFLVKELDINYRSCKKIVDICNDIINRNSNIISNRSTKCKNPLVAFLYKKDKEDNIINLFEEIIDKYELNHKNCKIIVRNSALKNKILGIKRSVKSENMLETLAEGLYLQKNSKDIEEYERGFLYVCKSIGNIYFKNIEHSNRTKFYTPTCIGVYEWKACIAKVINSLINEREIFNYELTWKEWKDKLNVNLENLSKKVTMLKKENKKLPSVRSGNSSKKLKETLFIKKIKEIKYDISTIHGSKGLSLDAVLFISSYQNSNNSESGSYWRQWFDTTVVDEKNRIAYVGFSRAKYLLALGIPKPKSFSDNDIKFLKEKGFEVIDVDQKRE